MRRGRPVALGAEAAALVETFLAGTPVEQGYAAVVWTVPLLLEALDAHGYSSCGRTLRKLLHIVEARWDRRRGWQRLQL